MKVIRLDKQLSRFPRNENFDFKGKMRWTFGGKSGHEAILEEMEKWRSDLYAVVTAIKLLQEEEQAEARDLYNPYSSSTATSNRDRLKRLETSSRTSKNSPSLSPKLTRPPCTSSAAKGPSIGPILSDLF
jgi:hypothetical protein